MKLREHIVWELVLLFSSVLVFRSLWMLMDRFAVLGNPRVLVVLLVVGVVLSIPSIYKLMHHD